MEFSIYKYNTCFYTGTDRQPDTISFIIKSKKEKDVISIKHKMAYANVLDMMPIAGYFTAIIRIINSVKTIFKELSQASFKANDPHLKECWNATKNLTKGLVALIPIIGTLTILVFEDIRQGAFIEPKIKKQLANKEEVLAIAIEGKIVFEVTIEQYTKKQLKEIKVEEKGCN